MEWGPSDYAAWYSAVLTTLGGLAAIVGRLRGGTRLTVEVCPGLNQYHEGQTTGQHEMLVSVHNVGSDQTQITAVFLARYPSLWRAWRRRPEPFKPADSIQDYLRDLVAVPNELTVPGQRREFRVWQPKNLPLLSRDEWVYLEVYCTTRRRPLRHRLRRVQAPN